MAMCVGGAPPCRLRRHTPCMVERPRLIGRVFSHVGIARPDFFSRIFRRRVAPGNTTARWMYVDRCRARSPQPAYVQELHGLLQQANVPDTAAVKAVRLAWRVGN